MKQKQVNRIGNEKTTTTECGDRFVQIRKICKLKTRVSLPDGITVEDRSCNVKFGNTVRQ